MRGRERRPATPAPPSPASWASRPAPASPSSALPPTPAPRWATSPTGARLLARLAPDLDVVVLAVDRLADLRRRLPAAQAALQPAGGLWVAWPKRASGVPTDVTEDRVREIGLAAGLVDNKVCAIDEVWSGLRFVVRLRDRPGTRRE